MGQRLSMATRHEITKRYATGFGRASKKDRGRLLDELVGVAGWSRANARRSIAVAAKRKGSARAVVRKGPPRNKSGQISYTVVVRLAGRIV